MNIPSKELNYYLGIGWGKMKMPEFLKALKAKGLKVDGRMTLKTVFEKVREAYAKETKRSS